MNPNVDANHHNDEQRAPEVTAEVRQLVENLMSSHRPKAIAQFLLQTQHQITLRQVQNIVQYEKKLKGNTCRMEDIERFVREKLYHDGMDDGEVVSTITICRNVIMALCIIMNRYYALKHFECYYICMAIIINCVYSH